jgi:Histidine kinase-like ATPase domain
VPRAHKDFAPVPESAAGVREFARETALSWGFVPDDLALVANELAVNAIEHAKSAFSVVLSLEAGMATVEVADRSPRLPRLERSSDLEAGGWGLQIVDALSARWGARELSTGKEVWAELALVVTDLDAAGQRLESR